MEEDDTQFASAHLLLASCPLRVPPWILNKMTAINQSTTAYLKGTN